MQSDNKADAYREYAGPSEEAFNKINSSVLDDKQETVAKNSAIQAAMMFLRGE